MCGNYFRPYEQTRAFVSVCVRKIVISCKRALSYIAASVRLRSHSHRCVDNHDRANVAADLDCAAVWRIAMEIERAYTWRAFYRWYVAHKSGRREKSIKKENRWSIIVWNECTSRAGRLKCSTSRCCVTLWSAALWRIWGTIATSIFASVWKICGHTRV